MTRLLKVVGLDPSMSNWGICKALVNIDLMKIELIEDFALVSTKPEQDKATKKVVRKNSEDLGRARALYAGMMLHTTGRAIAIAEVPVGSQSARAMASYGICVGVLAACSIPLIEVTPNEVKIAGAGHKSAAKEEMIERAMEKYPGAPWIMRTVKGKTGPTAANEHLADAVFAIEAGIETAQFQQMVAMYRSLHVHAA